MAKKFCLVSVGILALAIAYNIGAERARAEWDQTLKGQAALAARGCTL